MWQEILVYAILALAGGLTLWRFYKKFTGKAPCCSGGCSCAGSCNTLKTPGSDGGGSCCTR